MATEPKQATATAEPEQAHGGALDDVDDLMAKLAEQQVRVVCWHLTSTRLLTFCASAEGIVAPIRRPPVFFESSDASAGVHVIC